MSTEREFIQGARRGLDPSRPTPATRLVLRSRVVWSTATVLQIADVIESESDYAWISLPLVEQGREVDAQIAVASIDYYHEATTE